MPDPGPSTKLKLNPFAFPAETDSLFSLLIVVFLIMIFYQTPTISALYAIQGDTDAPAQSSPVIPEEIKIYTFEEQKTNALKGMYHTYTVTIFPLLLTTLALILTAIIYYHYPRRIIKKNGLVLLADNEHDSLKARLESVAQQLKLDDIPDFYIKDGLRSVNAQTFGTKKTYRLRLDEGLVKIVSRKEPKMFEAVILHEFAHFYHHDVVKNYLAKSLTIAVVLLLFVPIFLLLALTLGQNVFKLFQDAELSKFVRQTLSIATVILQCAALVGFFFFLRLQLLRARESYADYRASTWGAAEALVRIVQNKKQEKGKGLLRGLLRSHPIDSQRLKYLNEPERFFALNKSLPVITGVLLALFQQGIFLIVLPILMFLISSSIYLTSSIMVYAEKDKDLALMQLVDQLMGFLSISIVIVVGVALFFMAYLIVKTLILQILRHSVADIVTEGKKNIDYWGLLKTAGLLGAGYVLGLLITPFSILYQIEKGYFTLPLLLLPVSIFLFWLVFIWVNILTKGLIVTHMKATPPRFKFNLVMVLASFLIGFPLLLQSFVLIAPSMGDFAISNLFAPAMVLIATGVIIFFPLVMGGSWLVLFSP